MSQSNDQAFYQPYVSDEEALSDADTASEDSYDSSDTAAQGLTDPRYAIVRSAGPSFNTVNEQLLYQRGNLGSQYTPQPADTKGNSPLFKDPPKGNQTTLFSIKSANRDKKSYPTSSDFVLKTTRPFKNVTQIQIVNINYPYFLNYVPDASGFVSTVVNTLSTPGYQFALQGTCCFPMVSAANSIAINEVGRRDPLDITQPLVNVFSARPSRYDNNSLAQEMAYQMNNTPPFNLISYVDFRNFFNANKSMYILFNQPGLYFYNRYTKQFITSPTSADIYTQYYPASYMQLSTQPTEEQSFVAYYYPVLKEAMMDDIDWVFLNKLGNTYSTVYQKVVQTFEGLDSPFYYSIISSNVSFLSTYRATQTFQYYPIYQYLWSYNRSISRYQVQHSSLSPSITADITSNFTTNFRTSVLQYSSTIANYSTTLTQLNQTKAVLTDLQLKVWGALTNVGVPFAVYPATDISQLSYIISTMNPMLLPVPYRTETYQGMTAIANGTLLPSTFSGTYTHVPIYNFNWTSMTDLQSDSVNYIITPALYNPIYSSALTQLNIASIVNQRLGAGYVDNFGGTQITTANYMQLYSTFVSYQSTYTGLLGSINNIVSTTNSLNYQFLMNKYGDILPPEMLTTNPFISSNVPGIVRWLTSNLITNGSTPFGPPSCPQTSDLCLTIREQLQNWFSAIDSPLDVTSLPYRLGLAPNPGILTGYISTVTNQAGVSPFNVYMQLNIEKSSNNMDVARNEDLSITQDPTGDARIVLGKILTQGSGLNDITQTIIQNPARFEPPLGKLDRLHFTLYLDNLTPLSQVFPYSFDFSDWNAVVQIDEQVSVLNREKDLSTVPTVQWANDNRPF